MPEEHAVTMVMRATLMPEAWARSQVLRAKRMPLQSMTYLVGSMEIQKLRDGAARDLDASSFHRALLAAGPVPPGALADAFT
jgi:uncharacterized protein (DUF885 family)